VADNKQGLSVIAGIAAFEGSRTNNNTGTRRSAFSWWLRRLPRLLGAAYGSGKTWELMLMLIFR
jgi:hypothetical protein